MRERLDDAWWRIRFPLERALAEASDPGQFVVLDEEHDSNGRHRYAQALVLEDGVRLECVGPLDAAPEETGLWPITSERLTQLVDAGWALPDPGEYPNLWRVHPRGYVGETAKLMVTTLDILGCDPSGAWSTTGGTAPHPPA